jgi:hypothetical protein
MIILLGLGFSKKDWTLLYDFVFKDINGKLNTRWLGPYEIDTCYDNGPFKIKTIDEERISLLINGYRIKIYKKPIRIEEFTSFL